MANQSIDSQGSKAQLDNPFVQADRILAIEYQIQLIRIVSHDGHSDRNLQLTKPNKILTF